MKAIDLASPNDQLTYFPHQISGQSGFTSCYMIHDEKVKSVTFCVMIEVDFEDKTQDRTIFKSIWSCLLISVSGIISLVVLVHLHSFVYETYSGINNDFEPKLNIHARLNKDISDIAIKIKAGSYSKKNKFLQLNIVPVKDDGKYLKGNSANLELEVANATLHMIAPSSNGTVFYNFTNDESLGVPFKIATSLENVTEEETLYAFMHLKGNTVGIKSFKVFFKTAREIPSRYQDSIIGFSISIAIVAACIHIVFSKLNSILLVSCLLFLLSFTQIRFYNPIIHSLIICSYRALFAVYAARNPKGNAWMAEIAIALLVISPFVVLSFAEHAFIDDQGMCSSPISLRTKRLNDWAITATVAQGLFNIILLIASLFVNTIKDSISTIVLFGHGAVLFYYNLCELLRRNTLFGKELELISPQQTYCDRKYTILGSLIMIMVALSPLSLSFEGEEDNKDEPLLRDYN